MTTPNEKKAQFDIVLEAVKMHATACAAFMPLEQKKKQKAIVDTGTHVVVVLNDLVDWALKTRRAKETTCVGCEANIDGAIRINERAYCDHCASRVMAQRYPFPKTAVLQNPDHNDESGEDGVDSAAPCAECGKEASDGITLEDRPICFDCMKGKVDRGELDGVVSFERNGEGGWTFEREDPEVHVGFSGETVRAWSGPSSGDDQ